jgi:hydroxymethylpyrimidine/phosphomethylpyrimidine kinase
MRTALTIAGFDPAGGAGVQADLRVFSSFGVHGLTVLSALTAQNSEGVDAVFPVDRNIIERQLHVLLSDIRPYAVKLGMLYSKTTVELVAEVLKKHALNNLVIDPVTVSSSGISLVENGMLDVLAGALFPLSRVITPNLHEASVLSGIRIETRKDMEDAAKFLKGLGPDIVVITGGHLSKTAPDLFYDGEVQILEGEKMKGEYHGTGCVFSAAITALLALDYSPFDAVKRAKDFVKNAIEKAHCPGKGMAFLHL